MADSIPIGCEGAPPPLLLSLIRSRPIILMGKKMLAFLLIEIKENVKSDFCFYPASDIKTCIGRKIECS
jgi:hypothetical protein